MIQFIKHDVTKTTYGVVAHGCNCQGVMGSGVALAIRKRWPTVYERYQAFVASYRKDHHPDMSGLLGVQQIINVTEPMMPSNSLFVANLFTQEYYGGDGKVYANLDAVVSGLDATLAFCKGANLPLYLPRIGCGLGGLNWDTQVGPALAELVDKYEVEVFVCDL